MILVVSLNPCIDKTAALDHFEMDSANRVRRIREDVGGKGMNVARMLKNLGEDVHLMGFDFSDTPGVLQDALDAARVPHTLIPCPGALRVNLKIQDASRAATIEINEESAPVPPRLLDEMERAILSACPDARMLVLTGSLPKGAPVSFYRTLCTKAGQLGCPVAADCDGLALTEVLQASPHIIKPNRQELQKLLGRDIQDEGALIAALRQLMADTGVQVVCHSRGKEGAYLVTPGEAVFCPTLDVPVLGVYGAGDAMLAAVCAAQVRGLPAKDALCHGVASSCATILLPGTTMGARADFDRLLPLCQPRVIQ